MEIEGKSQPSLIALILTYLKVSNLTFGGGDPTMAVLQREFTDRETWMNHEQHALVYSLARITPGTNVLAYIAGSAHLMLGWLASVLAVLAASIPASVIAVWLTVTYGLSGRNMVAQGAVRAVIAAVVGMMGASAFALVRPYVTASRWPRALLFTGATLLLREWLQLGPVQLIALAAAAGFCWPEADRP